LAAARGVGWGQTRTPQLLSFNLSYIEITSLNSSSMRHVLWNHLILVHFYRALVLPLWKLCKVMGKQLFLVRWPIVRCLNNLLLAKQLSVAWRTHMFNFATSKYCAL
jgi:hypothetical protein